VLTCPSCGQENPEGARFCNACGSPLEAAPAREQRKTVTVVFCDVKDSTALGDSTDPEALRALLARYFERMRSILESHGATVEKFIGDAVMAVFGVPQVHEDDALRACRAAVEMRDALPELALQGRIGVNTGEVVTGTTERLATGDAVNVAARLEQAAQPGEILIGEETVSLVRDAVETEPAQLLDLKGKPEPVAAYRLDSVTGDITRRHAAPMVGRERQRTLLEQSFASVLDDRSCHLFTILGPAGVGKSRLVAEFLNGVGARVVHGRCLSYGEGITYWPVVEVLTQLGARPSDDSAANAIAAVLGETDSGTTPDEIAWAFRKTLEEAAADEALVCLFDDIHWGEPAFLDLVEHVADWSRDAPILLLCVARPELLDRRQGWAGGKLNATTVLLQPLSEEETDELIERIAPVDAELRKRIREAAEGNPLFVEEMLAMVHDAGNGDVSVPPTIQALLAARLDQLDDHERAVLERGAVEGKIFHRGAVEALAPEEGQVPQRLMALVRKELVRPDRPLLAGDDAFRFRHLLIRDAAYEALPKSTRAKLHEQFALWLGEHGAELVELDEIVGYHLEQASRYRGELGTPEDPAVKREARARLTTAGRRALLRADAAAAANLFERAAALVPDGELDLQLELDLVNAVWSAGDFMGASTRARALQTRGAASGNRIAELCGAIRDAMVKLFIEPEGTADPLDELTALALPEFEAAGDDTALFTAYHAVGMVAHTRAQMDDEVAATEHAVAYARRMNLLHCEYLLVPQRAASRFYGTTPIPELLAWLDEQGARGLRHGGLRATRADALAMLGRFDEARKISTALRGELEEQRAIVLLALAKSHGGAELEYYARDFEAAVRLGEEGCSLLAEMGESAWQSTAQGFLGMSLYELGRLDEAERAAERAAELGASDDVVTQMLWRQVKAKVRARRGALEEAEGLAREAVEIGEATDIIVARGEALEDLATVLLVAGRRDEAAEALRDALAFYERKGAAVMVDKARASLLELEQ
jgi:class 3 adenylate cyclase/tetratricopeptide (TPR) repeat protein